MNRHIDLIQGADQGGEIGERGVLQRLVVHAVDHDPRDVHVARLQALGRYAHGVHQGVPLSPLCDRWGYIENRSLARILSNF